MKDINIYIYISEKLVINKDSIKNYIGNNYYLILSASGPYYWLTRKYSKSSKEYFENVDYVGFFILDDKQYNEFLDYCKGGNDTHNNIVIWKVPDEYNNDIDKFKKEYGKYNSSIINSKLEEVKINEASVSEKLVINKDSIKANANANANAIQYICTWPTDDLYLYISDNEDNYVKTFRCGVHYYILTTEQFFNMINDNSGFSTPGWNQSKFWKVPLKYNNYLDDFIDIFTNNGSSFLSDYALSLKDIKKIKKTGSL